MARGANFCDDCAGGQLYATDSLCTLGLSLLIDGSLDREIECPLHSGRFNITHWQRPR